MRVPSGENDGGSLLSCARNQLGRLSGSVGRVAQIQLPDVGVDRSLHIRKQVATDGGNVAGPGTYETFVIDGSPPVAETRRSCFPPKMISRSSEVQARPSMKSAMKLEVITRASPPPDGMIYTCPRSRVLRWNARVLPSWENAGSPSPSEFGGGLVIWRDCSVLKSS